MSGSDSEKYLKKQEGLLSINKKEDKASKKSAKKLTPEFLDILAKVQGINKRNKS